MSIFPKKLFIPVLVIAIGVAFWELYALRSVRAKLAALRLHADALSDDMRQTRQQRDVALRRTDEARQRLLTLAATAKSPADIETEAAMNAWLDRAARLKQLRDERPDLLIPELALLPDEIWIQEARALHLESEDQIRDTFANLRRQAEAAFISKLRRALSAYLDAHGGTLPEDSRALASCFDPPVDAAMLERYKMAGHGNITDRRSTPLIQQNSPLDFTRDTVWDIGLNGGGSQPALNIYVRKAIQAFTQENGGAKPTLPEQLQPFLPSPVEPAKLQPYLGDRQ